MKLKHVLILLIMLNFAGLQTVYCQSDTVCFETKKAKMLVAGFAEWNICKIEKQSAIRDLNLKDKKIAKRNTAIIVLSSVVALLTGSILIK